MESMMMLEMWKMVERKGSKVVEDPMKDPIEKDSILTLPLKLNVVKDEH